MSQSGNIQIKNGRRYYRFLPEYGVPQVILTGQECLRLSSLGNNSSGYPASSSRRNRKDKERKREAYEIFNKSEREVRSGSQKLAEGIVDSL